jgi:uncharacterized protein YjiS (DUF1127 family)
MFAINDDKAATSSAQALKDLWGTVLEQLAGIDDRFGLRKLFHWLQDEAGRNATLEELDQLDDRCLDDMGIRRPPARRADDLVKLLRSGG